MSSLYDIIIVGAGIAGLSSAWFLKKEGMRPLMLERNNLCSGGSLAAGAFLSPKISKPSPYKSYLNEAFAFTTRFYQKEFPDLFYPCGLLKLPLDAEDEKRLQGYESTIDLRWQKVPEGYLFPDAGLIDPGTLCQRLSEGIDLVTGYSAKEPRYRDGLWHVGAYAAPRLLLTTGSDRLPLPLPYLPIKRFGGYRFDARFKEDETMRHTIHRDLSVSAFWHDRVIVGATFQRGIDRAGLERSAQSDSEGLLTRAKKIVPMEDLKILGYRCGFRASSFDLFPFVGEAIDHARTLEAFPGIAGGARVPAARFIHHPSLYLHTALGSRGFVLAPYNAKLLSDLILHERPMPERLAPAKRFVRWARGTGV